MRFERLDLNLLVALDALLEEQNVSAAADRVCLSQSSMSGALNRLREYFADELLMQVGRRMVLTPRAQELVEPVRNALNLIRTTIATKPEFDPASSRRTFRIVASDYIVDVLLSKVFNELPSGSTGLRFDVLPLGSDMFLKMERGETDLLITLDVGLNQDYPSELLFEEEHVVMAWRDNGYIRKEISEDQYFELPHVVTGFGSGARSPAFVEAFFEQQKRKRRIEISVPYFSMVPNLLVGTPRIATMLRRHAEHYARLMPVKAHPVPLPIPTVREAVQWHPLKKDDLGIHWLLGQIRKHAQYYSYAPSCIHRASG